MEQAPQQSAPEERDVPSGVPAAEDQDAAPTAPAAESTTTPAAPRRRRRVQVAGVLVGLGVLGGGALAAQGALGPPAPTPSPRVVVLPSPTPTVAPVAREPVSAFADGLPSTVLSFALTGIAEETPLLVAGALEGYRLEYSDGAAGTVTVLAGQWPTADGAREAAARLVPGDAPTGPVDDDASDDAPTSGEVTVDGAPAGTWSLVPGPDGAAVLVWTNGTAVLQVVGPPEVVRDVHAAFPY